MLEAIEKVCLIEKPGGLIVYGNTNSTLAGGLTAAKLPFPLAYVGAGCTAQCMICSNTVNFKCSKGWLV